LGSIKENQHARAVQKTDVALAQRIRERRLFLGLTQSELAAEADITFQQLQKYENGSNRISVSRLIQLAEGLKISPCDLIKDLSSRMRQSKEPMLPKDSLELVRAYSSIKDARVKKYLLAIAQELAD
jgi:transcriptional regulator with XRE-family HTH domain